jgi:putative transposase
MALNVLVASRPLSETSALRRALKRQRLLQHPRSSGQMQSLAKSGRDSHAARQAVYLANIICFVYIDANDGSWASSQPPLFTVLPQPIESAQYACGDYTQLLQKHGLRISMSRKANPYDNAKAESFMKTLKHEEVHRVEYRDLAEARRGIRHFFERTYNRKRLHSALGYRPPAEFDALEVPA